MSQHPIVKLFRRAKAAHGSEFATKVAQRFYRHRYAGKVPNEAAVRKYEWREQDHPRGQPENAGEFAEINAVIGDKPGEGVHTTLKHGSRIEQPTDVHARTSLADDNMPPAETGDFGSDVQLMDSEEDETGLSGPDPEVKPRSVEQLSGIESALSTGKIVDTSDTGDQSANEVMFVTLSNGMKGVFKPVSGEYHGGRTDIPDGTLSRREVAAYEVAKLIGLDDLVPVTVIHRIKELEDEGSMQEFCQGAQVAIDLPVRTKFDGPRDAARAIAFDFIMGNTDRHARNWMIGDGGKIRLIDNGFSLPEAHGLQTLTRMESTLATHYPNLPLDEAKAAWSDEAMDGIEKALSGLGISPAAIKMLDLRRDILLKSKDWREAIDTLLADTEKDTPKGAGTL